jgi:hypothetical protein
MNSPFIHLRDEFWQIRLLDPNKKIKEGKSINYTLMAGHNSYFDYMAGNTNSFNLMHKHFKFKRSSLIKLKVPSFFFKGLKFQVVL